MPSTVWWCRWTGNSTSPDSTRSGALSFAIGDGAPTIVVDLRRTRFLSLRNAFALVDAMDAALGADVETRVLTGRRQIERALEITGARARSRRTVAARGRRSGKRPRESRRPDRRDRITD